MGCKLLTSNTFYCCQQVDTDQRRAAVWGKDQTRQENHKAQRDMIAWVTGFQCCQFLGIGSQVWQGNLPAAQRRHPWLCNPQHPVLQAVQGIWSQPCDLHRQGGHLEKPGGAHSRRDSTLAKCVLNTTMRLNVGNFVFATPELAQPTVNFT